jgi:hypothetical protein
MERLNAFLMKGISQRGQVLQLDFREFEESRMSAMEEAYMKSVVTPLEIDMSEFRITPARIPDINAIRGGIQEQLGAHLALQGNTQTDAETPNINMEVGEKFSLKQKLLYHHLPHETYLLLSIGADLDPLLGAVEKFKNGRTNMDHVNTINLCADIFRGFGVRLFYQMATGESALEDTLDRYAETQNQRIDALIQAGTLTPTEIQAQLAALFLILEKLRKTNRESDEIYADFMQSGSLNSL